MTNDELIKALRYCRIDPWRPCDGCVMLGINYCFDTIHTAAADAIEERNAQLADKDYLIQQQAYEIQRLKADVKRQQEKMFELAKKLPKRGEIVRCGECKYYLQSDEECGLIETSLHFYVTAKRWTKDSFCS